MIVVDLKLGLLILLAILVGAVTLLPAVLRRLGRPRAVSGAALMALPDDLPVGLALIDADGRLLHTNDEARRLLQLDGRALPDGVTLLQSLGIPTASPARATGMVSQPVALRWWRYTLDHQRSALLLIDTHDAQRAIGRQQQLTGLLSHELRTPLTALLAHLEVVRSDQTTEPVRTASLATVQQETLRLTRLVRDLLEHHRIETSGELAMMPTNVVLLAEDAIADVFSIAEQRQVALALDVEAGLPLGLVHADRIKQVFVNVLDNAIKFGPPGTQVTTRLAAAPAGICCTVEDTGAGIPAPVLPHVTEPLVRGSAQVPGTGLGLSIVREILLRHGTALDITSSTVTGQSGTRCSWVLPAVPGANRL